MSCIDIYRRKELFFNVKSERKGELAQAAATSQGNLGFQFSSDQYSLVSTQEMYWAVDPVGKTSVCREGFFQLIAAGRASRLFQQLCYIISHKLNDSV